MDRRNSLQVQPVGWGEVLAMRDVRASLGGRLTIGRRLTTCPTSRYAICPKKVETPCYATLGSLGSLGSDKSGEMLETRDFLGSDRFFAVRRISRLYRARWYMTWRRVSSRRRWANCGPAESSEKAAAMRGSSGPSGWAAGADSRWEVPV